MENPVNTFSKTVVVYKPVGECMSRADAASRFLRIHGIDVFVFTVDDLPGAMRVLEKQLDTIDLALSIGGDGTFIRTARSLSTKPLILPYPCGRRNVYYEHGLPSIDIVLNNVLKGSFTLELLPICEVCSSNQCSYFINDVVIFSSDLGKVSKYTIEIKNMYFQTTLMYEGDGVIVSTSSGSGGHGLSARGPFVIPVLETLVVTPINPLQIGLSSIVIPIYSNITITTRNKASLYVDGDLFSIIDRNSVVEIGRSLHYIKVIRLQISRDYVRAVFEPRKQVL